MLDEFAPIVPPIVQTIVDRLSVLPEVRALALAGSQSTSRADVRSDFDIYVFVTRRCR